MLTLYRYFVLPHLKKFWKNEQGFTILEWAFIISAVVVFLGIAIPELLSHLGLLFNRVDAKLDGTLN